MTSCRHCQKWEVDRGGLCELCRAIFGVLNLVGRPEFLPEDFKFALDIQTRLLGRLASNLGSPAVFAALGDQSFPQHPPSVGSGGERFQEQPQSRYRPSGKFTQPFTIPQIPGWEVFAPAETRIKKGEGERTPVTAKDQ